MGNSSIIKLYVIIIAIVLSVVIIIAGLASGGGSETHKTLTCKVCGRTFEAGDPGGNFRSIVSTNMCKQCYKNFEYGMKATGK
ncbi:MAG: hypothetical protein IJL71_06410 [Oscillospiraceae bacterium]|nr:hypothetical protein [Oscillospiraceae bacterium]